MFNPRMVFGCCEMIARGWVLCFVDTAVLPLVQQPPKRVAAPQSTVGTAKRHPHAVQMLAAVSDAALGAVGVAALVDER